MIKTISDNQDEIISNIIDLHCDGSIQCDITYGNGAFYKNIKQPEFCYDIQPLSNNVICASSSNIPNSNSSLKSIMFDPPFLTYIKQGREHNSIMAKRFSGYWAYKDLEKHYKETLCDVSRVLVNNGIMIFKCQDIIHNHKMHPTHVNVINWAKNYNLELIDLYILIAKSRIPIKSIKKQQHARIYHSYFLVFKKSNNINHY